MLLPLCLAAVLLSALLVRMMIGVGVLDVPGQRSAHDRPTPKGGGIGVMAAFLLLMPLAARHDGALAAILGGVGLLALFAWFDDLHQYPPVLKLAAQALGAALALAGVGPLPGHAAGLLAGFVWLMFVTNALNFIDGLDGLASGSMALACLFVGCTAPAGLPGEAGWLLAAGLLGFLPFNVPRARIFLGDVGSQGAGLMVATLGLLCWRPPEMSSLLDMPLLLAGILYDVAFTLCRRTLAGERVWRAHRGHLYQVARRSGMPALRVALLHWGFVLWGGALGITLGRGGLGAPSVLALAALPQLIWTIFVRRYASRARLGAW